MSDIYQQIWDADQSGAGVPALLDSAQGDPSRGFVQVNTQLHLDTPDLRVLPDAVIPEPKLRTYDLCRALFDNYALRERDPETDTPDERAEVHDLVHAMLDTPPMQLAQDYVARQTGTAIGRERWYTTLMDMWFRPFSMGGDPHLTGFEHVAVGEQQGSKAQGYHFWYKYYLDDGFARRVDGSQDAFPGLVNDRITYLGSRLGPGQRQFPETVTISYRWSAPDYDRDEMRPLTKPTGGFFVGCSIEGLLALGSVRAHLGARAPKEATLNGARYRMQLYRSENGRHVRTFYPVFLGEAASEPPSHPPEDPSLPIPMPALRIIAALINPAGNDVGHETISLINPDVSDVVIDGWSLLDRNGKAHALRGTVAPGEVLRVRLDGASTQLSNKGGRIDLLDRHGRAVHSVTYSKAQVRDQGVTTLF